MMGLGNVKNVLAKNHLRRFCPKIPLVSLRKLNKVRTNWEVAFSQTSTNLSQYILQNNSFDGKNNVDFRFHR